MLALGKLFALKDNHLGMLHLNHILPILMIPSAKDAEYAEFWLKKGNELCNCGESEEALKAYDHALKTDDKLIDALNNKGLILASLSRFPEALQCFDEVLKLSPQHIHAMCNKGMFLAQQKMYQEALGFFEAAIAIDAYFAGAWYNKALTMQCLGRGKEAMAATKTANVLGGERQGRGCCGI